MLAINSSLSCVPIKQVKHMTKTENVKYKRAYKTLTFGKIC